MADETGTLPLLAREMGQALQPLGERLSKDGANLFFAELGLRVPSGFTELAQVSNALESGASIAAGLGPSISELTAVIEAEDVLQIGSKARSLIDQIRDLVRAISQIGTALDNVASNQNELTPAEQLQIEQFALDLPQRLIDFVLVDYLQGKSYALIAHLILLGLVDDKDNPGVEGDPLSPPFRHRRLHLNRLGNLLFDPGRYMRDALNWGAPTFDGLALFERLVNFLDVRDFPSTLIIAPGQPPILEVYILRLSTDPTVSPPNLTLRLRFPATQDFDQIYELRGPWSLSLSTTARFMTGLDVTFSPPLDITFLPPLGTAEIGLAMGLLAESPGKTLTLLGQTGGSRLEAQRISASIGIEATVEAVAASASVEPLLMAEIAGGKVVIDLSEGDSFITSLFSGVRIEGNFDLKARYQFSSGLEFEGSGGTELAIPAHIDLGVGELERLNFSLNIESGSALKLETSATVAASLGPLVVSIDHVGSEATATFPDGRDGNLGPLNLSFNFKPPSGIGLAINGGGFKGGGLLEFEPDEERYVGFLELEFKKKISLKAIGLLTTRLPGNDDGYSLLIIITAEFNPIQLGLGFTLNGVGGLLGLNRTANIERLRTGVKDNTLSSILFPQDIITNADRIISDLRQVFPPQQDRFIFGPMAKIGWGSPTLITIDLGLMIEVPSPVRLHLLGVIRAEIPNEEERKKQEEKEGREIPPILQLQVNFLGVVDFEAERLAFDSSLYNSKLLTFPLSGDMALRFSWGSDSNFLLTCGGFHPGYEPPPLALPNLQRLTLSLVSGNNPRIVLESYYAVTSNTIQFGARVELYAKKSKFNISGFLSYDVLFQFSPFYFIADIGAMLALRVGSRSIASISLALTLDGPTPWHAKGTAKFKIAWFFTLKIRFNKTFGEERISRLDDVLVLPLLKAALSNKGNWEAQLPSGRHALVSIKEINSGGNEVIVDPSGVITINQKVVPLNITIQKFGNQQPSDAKRFSIEQVRVGPLGETELIDTGIVKESFAPAQFFEKTDEEKLASKSFERYESGVSLAQVESLTANHTVPRPVEYETFYIDKQRNQRLRRWHDLLNPDLLAFNTLSSKGAIASSPLSHDNKPNSALAPDAVRVNQEQFVVVNVSNLRPLNEKSFVSSEAGAYGLMDELIQNNSALQGELQVVPSFEVSQVI